MSTQETAIQDSRTEGRGICLEISGSIRHVQIDRWVRKGLFLNLSIAEFEFFCF